MQKKVSQTKMHLLSIFEKMEFSQVSIIKNYLFFGFFL